jgi:NitT/TauT family transport system substrate-binding protein
VTAGIEEGIFEKHGIDLQVVKVKNTSEGAAALESGQADIASVLTEGVISLASAGSDTKIVANMLTEDQHILYAGEGITRIEDLVGKKVGVVGPGSGTEILAKHLFEESGLSAEQAQYVPSGAASAQVAALISGQIDSAGLVPPYDSTAEAEGLNKILEYRDVIPDLTPQVFATKQESLDKKAEALRNFIAAYTESTNWIVENEEAAIDILQKDTNTDRSVAEASYRFAQPDYSLDGKVSQKGLQTWLELSAKYGSSPETLTVDDIYDPILVGN